MASSPRPFAPTPRRSPVPPHTLPSITQFKVKLNTYFPLLFVSVNKLSLRKVNLTFSVLIEESMGSSSADSATCQVLNGTR